MSLITPTLPTVENIAYIQHEMRRIEGIIEVPQKLRHYVDLARRFNAIKSATCLLPMEVLSLIFQYSSPVPPIDDETDAFSTKRLFHLALRLVSSHWYNVVQSTPQLWTCVTSGPVSVDEGFAWYLKLCLEKSGSLPLTLCLSHCDPPSDPSLLVSPAVDDALRRDLYRIKSLQLNDAHEMWLSVLPAMFQLTLLEISMSTALGGEHSDPLDLTEITKLDNLYLSRINNVKIPPSAVSITRLELHMVPIDICVRLFQECENLVFFQCHSACNPRSPAIPEIPPQILERKSLSSLVWQIQHHNLAFWNYYVLEWTHFPALESLWWVDSVYPDLEYNPSGFFSRLPKSLTKLHITNIRPPFPPASTFIDYIRPDANISHIMLEECNEFFLHNIFHSLFKKTTADGEEIMPLPNLVRLTADSLTPDDWNSPSAAVGENLVRLLEERKGIINSFAFGFVDDLDNWGAEIWLRLAELKDGGLDLIIRSTDELV